MLLFHCIISHNIVSYSTIPRHRHSSGKRRSYLNPNLKARQDGSTKGRSALCGRAQQTGRINYDRLLFGQCHQKCIICLRWFDLYLAGELRSTAASDYSKATRKDRVFCTNTLLQKGLGIVYGKGPIYSEASGALMASKEHGFSLR